MDSNNHRQSRKILLPVDSSEHSERAVTWFGHNVYRQGDFVIVAFVIPPPLQSPTESPMEQSFVQEGNQAYNEGVLRAIELRAKFLALLAAAKVPESAVHFQELVGSKRAETLAKFAEEADVACVVIGSRGLGRIRRAFHSSVSHYLLYHTDCTVIICPFVKE